MRKNLQITRSNKRTCPFCVSKTDVVWEDLETVMRHITERGKILPRSKDGLCATHQRQLTQAVKWNRHLALLPFSKRL